MTQARPRVRTALLVLLACVILLPAVLAITGSQEGTCVSCHTPQASARQESAHAGTPCYGCHLQDGAWSWPGFTTLEISRMWPASLAGRPVTGNPSPQIARRACLACHADVLEGVTAQAGLRIAHEACAAGSSCDTCHAATAHGTASGRVGQPVMEVCIACHRRSSATTDCEACHTDKNTSQRLAKGPWQITHGPSWETMHGMGDLDSCTACHPADYCVRCHKVAIPHGPDFGGTHGKSAVKDVAACRQCHAARSFCDSCHGIEMPHPTGFLKGHGRTAEGPDDPSCSRCHGDKDCERCHAYHVHPGGAKGAPTAPAVKP